MFDWLIAFILITLIITVGCVFSSAMDNQRLRNELYKFKYPNKQQPED